MINMEHEKVFQEVDVFELLHEVGKMNKVLNAKVLQELEKHISDGDEFMQLRKFILDEQNSYTRSIVRLIFGDIEFMNFSKR
jgi:hypothetical protein